MMLQKLKHRLTLICSLSTTIIITLITLIALNFSEGQLSARRQINMQNTLLNVIEHLQNKSLSYSWLSQVECTNKLGICISTQSEAFSFPGSFITGETRTHLIETFMDMKKSKTYSDTASLIMETRYQKTHYMALITSTTFHNTSYEVLLIQDLSDYTSQIIQMRLFFISLIILGSALLSVFSFWFVGKAIKPIEISQKEQNEFIAAASHEMRSPLAVIKTSSEELLEDTAFNNNRFLNIITKECDHLTRFVNDLLFLASTDAGHFRLTPQYVEMDTLLLDVYDSFLPLVSKKEHVLDIDLPTKQFPAIYVDPDRITQVITILINNALTYTPPSTHILLSITKAKEKIKVTVSDNGPGIPDDVKPHIFKRFYRMDAARHDTKHYGLGLSIAYEIVHRHHGKLSVQDTSGGGTTFVILLPIAEK